MKGRPPRPPPFPYPPLSHPRPPLHRAARKRGREPDRHADGVARRHRRRRATRSEEHTSELQSHLNLVCRLLLEKKKTDQHATHTTLLHHSDNTTLSPNDAAL